MHARSPSAFVAQEGGQATTDAAKILFTPFSIGTMSLSNRIVHAPMHSNFGDSEGGVSDPMTPALTHH